MPNPSIFISYRIADTAVEARLLYTDLASRYGADAVFLDKKRLESGDDWPAELEANVRQAAVLLVLIKDPDKWLGVGPYGQRRMDKPDDWVRREIETALADPTKLVVPCEWTVPPCPPRRICPRPSSCCTTGRAHQWPPTSGTPTSPRCSPT
ncbi:MAG: toll/interleukin-1 receptor domain-containing protein [Saprospiraceae bacterium]